MISDKVRPHHLERNGDMLRIVMSSIMRCRSAEFCWDIGYSCLLKLHERAIFSDRIFNGHGHFPIVSHSQGSQNRYFSTHEEWLYHQQ